MTTKKKCDKYCARGHDVEAQLGAVLRCEHNKLFICYKSADDFFFAHWSRINPLFHPILTYKIRKYLK